MRGCNMSAFFYSLASEHIRQKVGIAEDLHYPNDTFYSFACIGIFSITVVLLIVLATQHSLHVAVFILHLDFCLIMLYLLLCMRLGKHWINTLICALDSIFITEDMARRRTSTQQRNVVRQPRQQPTRQEPVKQEYVEVHEQAQNNQGFLSVDMNKLDAAFKGGMFNRH